MSTEGLKSLLNLDENFDDLIKKIKVCTRKKLFILNVGQPDLHIEVGIKTDEDSGNRICAYSRTKLIGEVRSAINSTSLHRYLLVEEGTDKFEKGMIAHLILGLINCIESPLPYEHVRGYDLIIFYIREGYMPVSRDSDWESLESELVEYMLFRPLFREPERRRLPLTKLKLNPAEAENYWNRLISLTAED